MNVLDKYQTLMAAAVQTVIAVFALRPVYRQLALSRVQSSIATREVLIERAEAADRQRQQTRTLIYAITDEYTAAIFRDDPDETAVPNVNPEWAHEAEKEVSNTIRKLKDRQETKADPQAVDEAREKVIESAKLLEDCLSDLHQWISVSFDDPEYEIADPAAEKQKAVAACEAASKEISGRISEVRKRGRELDGAHESAIDAWRTRIREINDLLLKDERG